MLRNGNFSEGWETLPPVIEAGWLQNQRPEGWQIEWLNKGDPLYDDPGTEAKAVPECVHKLSDQLPVNERLGGKEALILDGDATYKIFNSGAAFGATLSQTVSGLRAGAQARLTAPIQAHLHGDPDFYGAESGVWVNGEGGWVNGGQMGDRKWYEHKIDFTVPESGEAEIVIRVKSKWNRAKDFFIDGVSLIAEAGDDDEPVDPGADDVVYVQVPPGFTLRIGVCEDNVIEVNAPEGVAVQAV